MEISTSTSRSLTCWSIKLAIEQTTPRCLRSSSMDFLCHYMKPSTSSTTQRHTKDGGKRPSNDRRSGFTFNLSNKDAISLNDFRLGPQNQVAWADSSHCHVHPYPIQMRWKRRQDQECREDLHWLMTNLLLGTNRIRNPHFPHETGTTTCKGKGKETSHR